MPQPRIGFFSSGPWCVHCRADKGDLRTASPESRSDGGVSCATTRGNGRCADAQMLPLGPLLSFTLRAPDPDAREEKMLFPPGRSFHLQDSEQRTLSKALPTTLHWRPICRSTSPGRCPFPQSLLSPSLWSFSLPQTPTRPVELYNKPPLTSGHTGHFSGPPPHLLWGP